MFYNLSTNKPQIVFNTLTKKYFHIFNYVLRYAPWFLVCNLCSPTLHPVYPAYIIFALALVFLPTLSSAVSYRIRFLGFSYIYRAFFPNKINTKTVIYIPQQIITYTIGIIQELVYTIT